jgi:hypothetical protein
MENDQSQAGTMRLPDPKAHHLKKPSKAGFAAQRFAPLFWFALLLLSSGYMLLSRG